MNYLKFCLAFALFYCAKSELTDENHSFEVVIKNGNFRSCKGFIVGSFWAVTPKKCVYGRNIRSLVLEDVRGDKYNVLKLENTRTWVNFAHLDVVLLKVDKSMGKKGIVLISPDLAEEGSQVQTQTNIKTNVSNYKKCESQFGNKGGLFCTHQKQPHIPISTGLYQNGMLMGIIIKSNQNLTVSISIPYVALWIIDTMSEIEFTPVT